MTPISLIFALGGIFSSQAHALSCMDGPTFFVPSGQTEAAATNVQPHVWYSYSGYDAVPVVLQTEDGVEVEADYVETGLNGVLRIEPSAELEPNTAYQIVEYRYQDHDGYIVSEFTTASAPDTTAPDTPVIQGVSVHSGESEWGAWNYLSIQLEEQDASGSDETPIYQVEVSANPDFSDSETTLVLGNQNILSVGNDVCSNTMMMSASDVNWVRVTAFDAAGNVSGLSEAAEVEEQGLGGCSYAASPVNAFLSLLAIPLVSRRRRRS